jgi:hypothetical protein
MKKFCPAIFVSHSGDEAPAKCQSWLLGKVFPNRLSPPYPADKIMEKN